MARWRKKRRRSSWSPQLKTKGDAGRHIVADALNKNGAIGEYSVMMKKFTDKLSGQMQAHHILEQKFVKKFALGEATRRRTPALREPPQPPS